MLYSVIGTTELDRLADVIYVHGINPLGVLKQDHAFSTWGGTDTISDSWPKWLGQDLAKQGLPVGIWVLEYDAAVLGWMGNVMPTSDRASSVIDELYGDRIGERPIVFIAHSLGGLVVKQILHRSATAGKDTERAISDMTKAVVFLATPHAADISTFITSLGQLLQQTDALKDLPSHRELLRELSDWYQSRSYELGIRTRSYFETKPDRGILVVDQGSADPHIRDASNVPVDATHSGISKISSRDEPHYKSVRRFLADALAHGGMSSPTDTTDRQPKPPSELSTVAIDAHGGFLQAPRAVASRHTLRFLHPPAVLHYVKRSAAEAKLTRMLVNCSELKSCVISVEGGGGTGKTTLVGQVVVQDNITALFTCGVFWLTIGRDRRGERLTSYICDVVQSLTGNHYATDDLALASAALIDLLSIPEEPVLLVLDDVWANEQVDCLLRGGSTVSRLVISRNKLGVSPSEYTLELAMMTREEAIDTLFLGVSSQVKISLDHDLLAALVSFSHRWPVLLAIVNGAILQYIAAGAGLREVADWIVGMLRRSGPTALDRTLSVSIEKSVEATLGATLDLISIQAQEQFYSLCIFDEDVVIPDHIIFAYWRRRYNLSEEECGQLLSMLSHLRLLDERWSGREPGRVIHDELRDFIIHRQSATLRSAMSGDLIESWRLAHLGTRDKFCWWHVSLSETFIFAHLTTHLAQAGLEDDRRMLLHSIQWYIAQIMALGSAIPAIADLEEDKDPTMIALKSILSTNSMLFRRESSTGGLAGTLIAHLATDPQLSSVLNTTEAFNWPILRPLLPLTSLTPSTVDGHLGPIGDIALSHDDCILATASDDKMALLLDAKTGAINHRLIGHTERVRSCSFSPDGQKLLTSGMDGTARVWDVATGESILIMGREGVGLLGSSWSPVGKLIAGSFADGMTTVWSASDGEVLNAFRTETFGTATWDCKFTDMDSLLTVGDDGHLRRWSISETRCTLDMSIHADRIRRCDISADGLHVLTASSDRSAALVDLKAERVVGYLGGHSDRLRSATFSADGLRCVTAAEDRTAKVWDITDLKQVDDLQGHDDWLGKAIFERFGSSIISCGGDANVFRWSYRAHERSTYLPSRIITRGGDDTSSCCFSRNGNSIYYGKVGTIRAISKDGRMLTEFGDHRGRVLSISTNADVLFSAGADGRIVSYDLNQNHTILANCIVGSRVWSLDVLHDAGLLISVAEDGYLRIHSTDDLTVLAQRKIMDGHLMACAKHPRKHEICLVGDGSKLIKVSLSPDLSTREILLEGYRSLWACAYSSDSTRIVVGGEPGTQTLILREDGLPTIIVETNVGRVTSAAFNCDGRLLATSGDDGYIGLWDTMTGVQVTGFRVHFPVRRCAWSPTNPKLLAAAGTGGEYLLVVDNYFEGV